MSHTKQAAFALCLTLLLPVLAHATSGQSAKARLSQLSYDYAVAKSQYENITALKASVAMQERALARHSQLSGSQTEADRATLAQARAKERFLAAKQRSQSSVLTRAKARLVAFRQQHPSLIRQLMRKDYLKPL